MEHSGFFNGEQEYGQDEFCRYFDNIYQSGVSTLDKDKMSLEIIKEGTALKISTGFAIIKGFYLYNDSIKTINVSKDTNYDRIDRVVVRLNINSSKVSIELKSGIASSKPVVPVLQRDNLIFELSLAQIKITPSSVLTITDERYRQELCGSIRPKNLTEFNTMLTGFTDKFDKWFDSQQSKGWRNIFIQPAKPVGSVVGSIWIKII